MRNEIAINSSIGCCDTVACVPWALSACASVWQRCQWLMYDSKIHMFSAKWVSECDAESKTKYLNDSRNVDNHCWYFGNKHSKRAINSDGNTISLRSNELKCAKQSFHRVHIQKFVRTLLVNRNTLKRIRAWKRIGYEARLVGISEATWVVAFGTREEKKKKKNRNEELYIEKCETF